MERAFKKKIIITYIYLNKQPAVYQFCCRLTSIKNYINSSEEIDYINKLALHKVKALNFEECIRFKKKI